MKRYWRGIGILALCFGSALLVAAWGMLVVSGNMESPLGLWPYLGLMTLAGLIMLVGALLILIGV